MNKGKQFRTEVLTQREIEDLIECLENTEGRRVDEMMIARNLAAFMLMYRAGLRREEVSQLDVKDIDVEGCVVHVRHGKGNKERRAGIDPKGMEYVKRWIKLRGPEAGPLFMTFRGQGKLKGNRVHAGYWNKMMSRLAEETGIGKRCNPHSLRHTHANELRREGVNTYAIMKQLGHANIQTTERYLDHLEPREVVDAIKGREW